MTPERRALQAEYARALWAKPGMRERIANRNRGLAIVRWRDPEYRAASLERLNAGKRRAKVPVGPSPEETERLIELRRSGLLYKQIAYEMGISRSTVQKRLQRLVREGRIASTRVSRW